MITGILIIGLGLLYGLGMPLLLRSVPYEPGMPRLGGYSSALLASVGAWFSAIGAVHVIIGIGTFRFRRWAADVIVAACWAWIALTVLSLLSTLSLFPKLPAIFELAALSEGAETPAFFQQGIVSFVFAGFLVFGYALNLLPALVGLALFRSRDVRATIAAADPVPGWTARVPMPALAWWALLVGLAGTLVPLLPSYGWMTHLAGLAASPVVGSLLVALGALVLAGLAWGTATRAP